MQQIKDYMARRDSEDLEKFGLISINLLCMTTMLFCITSIM
jgi:hypothetical protein